MPRGDSREFQPKRETLMTAYKLKLRLIYSAWSRKTKIPPWLIATTVAGAALQIYAASLPPIHTVVTLIDPNGVVNLAKNYPIDNPEKNVWNTTGSLLMLYPWLFWIMAKFLGPLMHRLGDKD